MTSAGSRDGSAVLGDCPPRGGVTDEVGRLLVLSRLAAGPIVSSVIPGLAQDSGQSVEVARSPI